MNTFLTLLIAVAVSVPLGWVFRAGMQSITSNAPKWRDMPLSVAWGYVLGAGIIVWVAYNYYLSVTAERVPVDTYFFFRNAVHGF
ncbi:MAG: ABC transporter permease, partial [Pseudomonadota bacterium]